MFSKDRKLLNSKEGKITFIQIIGFILIILGIITILVTVFRSNNSSVIAVAFFIIMLGFAFAFPSLLEGNRGISTMRIVVFMMVNVICLLLLKIGWNNNVHSFEDIGFDGWWMGVIAFVFGAKTTQAYFESKLAAARLSKGSIESSPLEEIINYEKATPEIIEETIKTNGENLIESFPNVTGLSVRNKIIEGRETQDCALIFKVIRKDVNLSYGMIPSYLIFKSLDGKTYKIITDVIEEKPPENNGAAVAFDDSPFPLGNSISREFDLSTGSCGLLLNKLGGDQDKYLMSCYHVFCAPELKCNNKTFSGNSANLRCASVEDNGTNIVGEVVEGLMNITSDFAISRIDKNFQFKNSLFGWEVSPENFAWVLPRDKGRIIKMSGRTSGKRQGKIKSHYSSQKVYYCNRKITQYFTGLVEIDNISKGGDSGAAVLDENDNVIGLIIASNLESSYVLPVRDYIINNNYTL
jgi:hypothetical protein